MSFIAGVIVVKINIFKLPYHHSITFFFKREEWGPRKVPIYRRERTSLVLSPSPLSLEISGFILIKMTNRLSLLVSKDEPFHSSYLSHHYGNPSPPSLAEKCRNRLVDMRSKNENCKMKQILY